jgi:hypothetical protein
MCWKYGYGYSEIFDGTLSQIVLSNFSQNPDMNVGYWTAWE